MCAVTSSLLFHSPEAAATDRNNVSVNRLTSYSIPTTRCVLEQSRGHHSSKYETAEGGGVSFHQSRYSEDLGWC
jgi:hypothetical protein